MSGIDYAASNFVDIVLCPRAKYIAVKNVVTDDIYVWSSPEFRYHGEILNAFGARLDFERDELCVLGGGFLRVDTDAKTIHLWGSSGEYGDDPDRNATVSLIKHCHPDYDVTSD